MPGIDANVLAEIKARINLADLIEEYGVNLRRMGETLGLTLSQMNSVDALNRSFNDDLKALVGAADADRKALLDNAVANDFKRMSYVLTPAQLSKYEILINTTLANRGMEK